MPRILLLIPSATGVGGTERMVANLARLLSREHEVHVASFDPASAVPYFDLGVPFHPLGESPRMPLPFRPLTYAIEAMRLKRLKRRLGIELTISNLWRADLVSMLSATSDRKVALCHINVVGNRSNTLMLKLLPIVRAVYGRFDKVVAVSEVLKHELADLYQLTDMKVCHIDNFIDIAAEQGDVPRQAGLHLVWCGRFAPEKNTVALMDIFAGIKRNHPQAVLTLVGAGPQLEMVRQRAIAHGLRTGDPSAAGNADVVFLGSVQDPLPTIRGADLLLLTSISEGLPMTLLEAAALGTPIAASDCPAGGVATLLMRTNAHEPGRRQAVRSSMGVLLPVPDSSQPDTIDTWVAQLSEILKDETVLQSMRAGALSRSRDFTPEAAGPKWRALIAQVGGQGPSPTAISVRN